MRRRGQREAEDSQALSKGAHTQSALWRIKTFSRTSLRRILTKAQAERLFELGQAHAAEVGCTGRVVRPAEAALQAASSTTPDEAA